MSTVTAISQAVRQELPEFQGQLIGPDDTGYEEACKVYNAMIDKRPALIARCAGPEDVSRAVGFARDHGLLLAVRGGGHNGAGLGTCDDGVVIDLSLLKEIEVDPQAAHGSRRRAAARGERSTPRPTRPAWPRRAASSPRPASAGSRSAAALAT